MDKKMRDRIHPEFSSHDSADELRRAQREQFERDENLAKKVIEATRDNDPSQKQQRLMSHC